MLKIANTWTIHPDTFTEDTDSQEEEELIRMVTVTFASIFKYFNLHACKLLG